MEKSNNEKITDGKILKFSKSASVKADGITKSILQFTSDSIGLQVLKKTNNKDLAYKIIKNGRKIANTSGKLTAASINITGNVLDKIVKNTDTKKVKNKVSEISTGIGNKVKETIEKTENEIRKSEELNDVKNKVSKLLLEKIESDQRTPNTVGNGEEVGLDLQKIEDVKQKIADKFLKAYNEANDNTKDE